MTSTSCLVCGSKTRELDDSQMKLHYHVCDQCEFIFKNKAYLLTKEQEEQEYLRHNNTLDNVGYINMFQHVIDEYIKPLNIQREVLDFGSGPSPIFRIVLERQGFDVYDYDPFYNDNEEYKNNTYQLITSIEVVEHFYDPIKEFTHMTELLEDNGYLIIQTLLHPKDDDLFLKFWYRRDPSHVSFYSLSTLEVIAQKVGLHLIQSNDKNIIVFQKK